MGNAGFFQKFSGKKEIAKFWKIKVKVQFTVKFAR